MNNRLTKGHVLKVLLIFALPYLLASFLQSFYGMADLYIVGQFNGADIISAVSIGSQFMHLITVIIIGLAMGATIRIGHAVGREDYHDASCIVGNTALLFIGIALVITVMLICLTSPIIQLMSTPPEAIKATYDYLIICFIGIPFIFSYNVISSIYRGAGDSKSPMYFVLVSCMTNIILDYIFVGYFHLGASGAALATVCAQALSTIIALLAMMKKSFVFPIQKKDFRFNFLYIRKILSSGIPIALQDGLIQVSFLIITIIANSRGLIFATGVGITEKIISFLFLVPSAFLSALSASVAQNIGANKPARAKQMLKYGLMITVTFGCVCAMICQMIPQQMIGLFTHDQAVIQAGSLYLMAYGLDCIFASIHFCFSGYFCGCNRPTIPFVHNLLSIVLIRIPGAYFASLWFVDTLYPMGLAAPLGSILSSIICIRYYILTKNTM